MSDIEDMNISRFNETRNVQEENDDEDEEKDEKDIMKILIASDIHLGYEQTTKRGNP